MTAPDLIAEIAARYGASVAPGVTVQRLPTGASSRPYPVWDGAKNQLVVPDWKAEAERRKLAGIRKSRAAGKKGRARDAALMERLIAMNNQGMRPASIGAAVGLSADQVYRLLKQAGHAVARVNPGPSSTTLERVALVRRLVAEGKTRAEIAAALGFADIKRLGEFCRRAAPDLKLPPDPRLARMGVDPAKGRDMTKFRADQQAHVSKLLADGADEAAIGAALQIKSARHLRRVIRAVAPEFIFAKVERVPAQSARDAEVRRLIATLSFREVSTHLGLTVGQIAASVRRLRKDGLLAPEVEAARATRRRKAPRDTIATRDAAVLRLIRDLSYAEVGNKLGLRVNQVKASVTRLRAKGDLPPSSVERMPMRPGSMNGAAPKKPERTAAILHRHGLGQTVDRIAKDLGCPRRAVFTALERAGQVPRTEKQTPKADRLAALPGLVAQGLTARQIGERWGKSESYVYNLAHDAKISLGRNARPHNEGAVSFRVAARRERVRMLYTQGKTHAQMCDILQISQATLSGDIKALGLAGTSAYALRRRKASAPEAATERRAA